MQVTVTEFHHPGFNHYFITAHADEAAHLATGGLPPWVPTGHTFKVLGGPDQGITNVCRFFSATFAPRSSHFCSNNPAECPGLSARGVWPLEASAAFFMMPTANLAFGAATGATSGPINVTSPNNVAVRLSASIVPAADGSVLVNTTGAGTVGAYSVQVSGLRIDADLCTTGPIGGSVSFSRAGQTGTFTFNSSCSYTYSDP